MTNKFLWRDLVFSGLRAFVACTLGISMVTAQTSVADEEVAPPITSAPSEIPQEDNGIDYKNAKPIPMPSLPDPTPVENLPASPSTGERKGHPGSAPGCTGTGKENPQTIIPLNPS